jgi:erythritol transport system substrate-binding protein
LNVYFSLFQLIIISRSGKNPELVNESCKPSRKVPWFITLAIGTMAAAAVTVFQPSAYGQQLIGIIVSSPGDWFDGEIAKAADSKARQLGYVTLVLYHEQDVDLQEKHFGTLISRRAAAIVCDSAEPSGSVPALEKAKEEKIPVFLVGRPAGAPGLASAEILANERQGATLGAHAFAKAMAHEGDYIELIGFMPTEAAQARSDVYNEILGEYPQLRKLDAKIANWKQADAKASMRDLLVQYPTIKGILCGNDWMALGALDALKEAGEHKIVVGFDGIPQALEAVRGKIIVATVELPAQKMGERAVEEADQFIKTGKLPRPGRQLIDCTLYPPKARKESVVSGERPTSEQAKP